MPKMARLGANGARGPAGSPAPTNLHMHARQQLMIMRQHAAAMRGSYRAVNNPRSRQQVAGWNLSGDQHADSYSRRFSREMARDLERNAGGFVSIFNDWCRALVGDGVRTRPTTANAEWNAQAGAYLHAVYSKVVGGLDVRDQVSFYGLQNEFIRAVGRDGDMALLKLRLESRLAVQLFEAEQIESSPGAVAPGMAGVPAGTHGIIGGVAITQYGAPLAYCVRDYASGFGSYGGVGMSEPQWLKAADVSFSKISNRYSQTRGIPLLVAVLDDFERVDSYMESEVIAAEQGSQIYGVMTFPQGFDPRTAPGATPPGESGTSGINGGRDADGAPDWQPTVAGSIMMLPNGAGYTAVNPQRPNKDAEPFLCAMLRFFCAVTGRPYEIVFNDLRSLSWSTVRALVSAARKVGAYWQAKLLGPMLSEVYRWVIADAIQRDLLPPMKGWELHEHEWPMDEWPDPQKEAQAQKQQRELGTTSLHQILGGKWKDIARENATEVQFADQLNMERWIAAHMAIGQAKAKDPTLDITVRELISMAAAMSKPDAFLTAANTGIVPEADPEDDPEAVPAGAGAKGKGGRRD
jgi:capsid protein